MTPRIRKRRDNDWEPSDEDFPEARKARDADDVAEEDEGPPPAYQGYEQNSGDSWLSNAVIIGSLPDSKLREAIRRYKRIIHLLEQELAARSDVPRRDHPKSTTKSTFVDWYAPNKAPRKSVQKRGHVADSRRDKKAVASSPSAAKLKLTHDQLLQALEMLEKLKIKSKGNKDDK